MGVKNYGHKPQPKFDKDYKENELFLGIELELECKEERSTDSLADVAERMMNKEVYCKSDSSIDYGFEMVSHPKTIAYHRNGMKWSETLEFLRKEGCTSHNTSTCGIHVHFNNEFLSPSKRIALGVFFARYGKNIVRIARRYSGFGKIVKIDKKNLKKPMQHGRQAINFGGRTIEIRIFRGSLVRATVLATLEFVDSIARFVKVTPVKTLVRGDAWNEYIKYVTANSTTEEKEGKSYKYRDLLPYLNLVKAVKPLKIEEDKIYFNRGKSDTISLRHTHKRDDREVYKPKTSRR